MSARLAVWTQNRPYNPQSSTLSAYSAQTASLFPFGSSPPAVSFLTRYHGQLALCSKQVLTLPQGIFESSFSGYTKWTLVSSPTAHVLFKHRGLSLSHS